MAELERLNHLKDEILSTITQELYLPITNIKLATQLLESTLDQKRLLLFEIALPTAERYKITQYLRVIQEECEREIGRLNNLLELQQLDLRFSPWRWKLNAAKLNSPKD